MELTVAKVYGRALYDAAAELGKIDEIEKETEQINNIFQREKEFYSILTDPSFSVVRKKKLLKNIFEGRISRESLSFLYILADKDRMHNYRAILREFVRTKKDKEGVGDGIIYSAVPLNEEQIAKLEKETGRLLDKKIKLKNKIDKSMIGGVKIIAEDKLIDASIRRGLERLRSEIKEI